MPSAKDINGKEWAFTVNVASLARVKEKLGFDLLSVVGEFSSLNKLYADPIHLTSCLFWLCNPSEITLEKFQEGWSGESVEKAFEAVSEGVVDFFPNSRRQIVKDLLKTFAEIMATARQLAPEEIQTLKANAIKAMQPKTSGDSSGGAPESSESILENSPSGS